jgi:DNA-binding MarR family transcriptional regulator
MSDGPVVATSESGTSPTEMQQRFVAFVRAFGLHRPEETPCGAPVPVSEAHAVSVLDEMGALSQSELARHLELTKSTVSRLVDQLVNRGWATRRPATDDARRRLVELTPAGQNLAGELAQRRQHRLALLLDRIPKDERAGVIAALETLTRAARDEPDR